MLINNFLCGAANFTNTNQSNEWIPWKPFNSPFGAATSDIDWLLLIQGRSPVAGGAHGGHGGAPDNPDYEQPRGVSQALSATYLSLLITLRYSPDKF